MKWWRKIGLVAVAAAVVAAVVYGFMPRPVPVETAKASRGPLRVTVEEEGKTRVKDRFVISAPVAGFARRIGLEAGDPVAKGDTVAELEPARPSVLDPRTRAEAAARLRAAEASLKAARQRAAAARADAEYAASELSRVRGLQQKGFASLDDLERAEASARRTGADLRSAEFGVKVAAFQAEEARMALDYSMAEEEKGPGRRVLIRTPVDGRVLRVFHKSEGVVAAGTELLEVGDPAALEVEVDLLSEDSVRVAPGTRVLLERWGGQPALEARVRVVEPAGFTKVSALGVEEQRVHVISEIVSPQSTWQRLGDGYRVEASFVLWEGAGVLQVPSSALFRHGEGWAVFVVEAGRARRRAVETGHRSGLSTEITSGLKEGETVITHPDRSVEDGTRVRPR
jgi:HlyD family secretion protein